MDTPTVFDRSRQIQQVKELSSDRLSFKTAEGDVTVALSNAKLTIELGSVARSSRWQPGVGTMLGVTGTIKATSKQILVLTPGSSPSIRAAIQWSRLLLVVGETDHLEIKPESGAFAIRGTMTQLEEVLANTTAGSNAEAFLEIELDAYQEVTADGSSRSFLVMSDAGPIPATLKIIEIRTPL